MVKLALLVVEIICLPFCIISIFTVRFPIIVEIDRGAVNLVQLVALVYVFIPFKQPDFEDIKTPVSKD